MNAVELSERTLISRLPIPLQKVWNWLLSVPDGVDIYWRAWFGAARVRIMFAVEFGFVYWHFYLTKRNDPFYSREGLDMFIRFDVPLRLAWIGISLWTLFAATHRGLRFRNMLTMVVEAGLAANIVIHTGALSSSFLFIYAIYPMVSRLAFDRVEAWFAGALSIVAAMGGAWLSVSGRYPEAAFYTDFTRATFHNPQVSLVSVGNLFGGLFTGIVLAEWARHMLDLREQELRQVNASLQTALNQIERQQRQLVETGALAAIGEFVRGAAHEIGNPLASAHSLVMGVKDDLSDGHDKPLEPALRDEFASTLGMALTGQERVRSIVKILHALSIHTEVKSDVFELNQALKLAMDVKTDSKPDGGPAPQLSGVVPDVKIFGNCDQLGDALGRIVQNGREFASTRLTVSVRHDPASKRVWIVFEDDGPGFTPEALKTAVEPFSTTRKADKKHLGLGLFIARVIIGRMGGLLNVENTAPGPSGGARVTVELPVQ